MFHFPKHEKTKVKKKDIHQQIIEHFNFQVPWSLLLDKLGDILFIVQFWSTNYPSWIGEMKKKICMIRVKKNWN